MDGRRPVWEVKVIVSRVITSIFFRRVWAANHSVGEDSGWDLNSNLQAWSSGPPYMYLPLHSVLEVDQIDYIVCRTTNPIKAYTNGESVIRLHEPGMRYFICRHLRHCSMALKLRVRILESDNRNNSTDDSGDQDHDHGASNQKHSPPGNGTPAVGNLLILVALWLATLL